MTDDILGALRESMKRFPNCRIANCDCDELVGEWKPGCYCAGHWKVLNEALGSDWSLADAAASAKAGKPVRAE